MIRVFTSKNQVLGKQGENAAATWLLGQGFKIVDRNVANKFGEIDIVAKKGSIIYFFEVKAGRAGGWINPAENLTQSKIRKFLISCEHYALTHNIRDSQAEALLVILDPEGKSTVERIDIS